MKWTLPMRGLVAACLVGTGLAGITPAQPVHAAGATFYVDCLNGNDVNPGTSTVSPWKSITKVNKYPLQPGDTVLFARGCTWSGSQLGASWIGTAAAPITIGAYGGGALPTIKNGGFANIKVTGAFLVLQDLNLTFDPVRKDPCGQPLGEYYGITFTTGSHDDLLRRSTSSAATGGVHLGKGSTRNRVIGNQLVGNNVLETFNDATPSDDLGAWGMVVHSDGNEIAYNTFKNNAAVCTMPGQWIMSNSVELYEASNNSIHHNRAYGDRVFSELGSSATVKSVNNRYFDNLYSTTRPYSRFIVTRGPNSPWGPVTGTILNHNTSYQTGTKSQGVVCDSACGSDILTVSGSIIWAELKAVYADGPINFSDSLVWNTTGVPPLQLPSGTTLANIVTADPGFVGAPTGNLGLLLGSPAIDADFGASLAGVDLLGTTTPQGLRADMGAYEFHV